MPNIYYDDYDAIIALGDFCSDELRSYMFQALNFYLKNPKNRKIEWYNLLGKRESQKLINK
ncbi:MAG: hypothetical protein K0B02_01995 [DPANN group archaeon]|nr:hypothetical protein [DPANN group archaeon]